MCSLCCAAALMPRGRRASSVGQTVTSRAPSTCTTMGRHGPPRPLQPQAARRDPHQEPPAPPRRRLGGRAAGRSGMLATPRRPPSPPSSLASPPRGQSSVPLPPSCVARPLTSSHRPPAALLKDPPPRHSRQAPRLYPSQKVQFLPRRPRSWLTSTSCWHLGMLVTVALMMVRCQLRSPIPTSHFSPPSFLGAKLQRPVAKGHSSEGRGKRSTPVPLWTPNPRQRAIARHLQAPLFCRPHQVERGQPSPATASRDQGALS
mmetsp:Transcript_11418/g.32401  ORF Transcript_11418/g.32401 Transcript_11418/m.32401 type:complete len:260 (-) Transcript_11418:2261-3040(-)